MATWQIQQAKAHLSQVVDKAQTEGPQYISRHGVDRAVIVSLREYEALRGKNKKLSDILLGGPKSDEFAALVSERDRTPYEGFELDHEAS